MGDDQLPAVRVGNLALEAQSVCDRICNAVFPLSLDKAHAR